jgi:two-component system chemotaxis response regulator CheB
MAVQSTGVTLVPPTTLARVNQQHHLELSAANGVLIGNGLFRSAAEVSGPRLIAVVLSGMRRDGAEGVQAVRRHGGRVLAQDPATAAAPEMPAAAIATGCVDFVLPPERIASALVALAMAPGAAEFLRVAPPSWASL